MNRTVISALAGLVLVGLLAVACAAPATVTPAESAPTQEPAGGLNIYNWDTYIDPAVVSDFEREWGVTVDYEIYGSNEEMLQVLEAGGVDYDLVFPTDYIVPSMIRQGLLASLNLDNIPNLVNLDPAFVSPFYDPGNRYCVAYQWGTIGVGYNGAATGRELAGWSDLFAPEFAGRIALLDDPRLSLGVVLLYLGHSPNTTTAEQIAAARDFLIERSDQIVAYAPDTGQDLLAAGQVDLTLEWSGDIFQLMAENPDVRYVIPEEGTIIYTDNMCVPAASQHRELAEAFINYVLEPEVGAAISNYIHFSSPNLAAQPYLLETDRQNPALYPSPEVRARLFFLSDVGQAADLYDQAWADVMAAFDR